MATTKVDFSAFRFGAEEVKAFNEIIIKKVLESPELNLIHTFETNIRNDQEIGFIEGSLGLIGKAAQGCGTRTPDEKSLATSVKTWSPKRWEVYLQMCWTDLESNFGRYLRNLGVDVSDLTNTEYAKFLEPFIIKGIKNMLFRLVWIGDTTAATTADSPAGVFTAGTNTAYFNLIDGIFKQLGVIIAATPARKTTIAANGEATFALQDSAFTNALAWSTFLSLIDDAPTELKELDNTVVIMTDSCRRRIMRHLQSESIDFTLEQSINGMQLLKADGYEIIGVPMWDKLIRTYQSNGTKYNSPHRMLFTTKDNLPVGFEGNEAFGAFKLWQDDVTEYTYIKTKDALDAKVLEDNLIQYAI